ncbi:MAG: YgeY family selenium metabolism-linked hydrolase [Caldilineaceae bacterium]|nr:YgeY family selenium metabolism-linked hydrolase [Caldilineaceae bacterium]
MDIEQLIEFTQALVQLPSLSGQEGEAARRVESEMRSLGFDQVYTDENGSVIGIIEGAQPGKTILLDAHTDTVGISPGAPWAHDPFGAQVVDNALYGRGAADMKGALAAMVHAAAALDRRRLCGRVIVSASTLEEVLEGVALRPIVEKHHPDFVVIGEATDLNIARGGRGRAEVHLETVGRPAHSSSPQLGRNAVLDMMRVIAAVETVELPTHPVMGPAILALTDIISDPYPGHSVIPSMCKATYDRRLLPGETPDGVLAAITGLPGLADIDLRAHIAVGEYNAYTGATLRADKFFPAWLLPEEEWFVRRALHGAQSAGLAAEFSAYRFCTNAAYSAGVAGLPTVGFGPAKESDAHVVDERLQLADLIAAARGYQGIIEAVLGASEE